MRGRLRALNERFLPRRLMFGPQCVVLGVNNFCNLRCVMCDVGTGDDQTNFGANLVGSTARSMPIELFRRIADQIVEHYPHASLALAYTEPLAWAPLLEALDYARILGVRTALTSNGLLLPAKAEALARTGLTELAISVDGPAEVHDAIRRRKGSYARAVEGIRTFTAQPGAAPVAVYCTITERNVGRLRDFLDGVADLKLRRVGLIHNNFVTPELAALHNHTFGERFLATASNVFEADPTAIDIEALSIELTRIAATRYPFPVMIQPNVTDADGLEAYYRNPERPFGRRCTDIHRLLMIDSDGEVLPANGRCYRFPIANVRTESLKEIWNHPSLAAARQALNEAGGLLPACSRCCGAFN
jgi:MoaA/NifB/PqqE/SkfB family radical SAM enzyme